MSKTTLLSKSSNAFQWLSTHTNFFIFNGRWKLLHYVSVNILASIKPSVMRSLWWAVNITTLGECHHWDVLVTRAYGSVRDDKLSLYRNYSTKLHYLYFPLILRRQIRLFHQFLASFKLIYNYCLSSRVSWMMSDHLETAILMMLLIAVHIFPLEQLLVFRKNIYF